MDGGERGGKAEVVHDNNHQASTAKIYSTDIEAIGR